MSAPEPTIADVLARLDVISLEARTGFAEVRASIAEARVAISELRQDLRNLDQGLRDLWTEHWAHSHPDEGGA
jgi:hypothetical protein